MSNSLARYSKRELAEALTDVLEGTKCAREIHSETGFPLKRCEEIYAMHCDLLSDYPWPEPSAQRPAAIPTRTCTRREG